MTNNNLSLSMDDFSMDDFRNGKQEAFEKVYASFKQAIYYFVKEIVAHEQEADDITTETFTKLWKLRANFTSLNKIRSFLYVTARNASVDYLRKVDRDRLLLSQFLLHFQNDQEIINETNRPEVIARINEASRNLSPQCRQIIELLFIEGLSIQQTADRLGTSALTVRVQKKKALDTLRRQIIARPGGL
ncbi:MAG: sigma-70 family RNA polymerase sigma factor [Chitinophagaceae bacterium]|nr:sigma-70 family RNA polymerase sigma factor [Chitinophagaceae bacterium]